MVSFSPMFHWTEHNIHVHVFTCVLALQVGHLGGAGRPAGRAGPVRSANCSPSLPPSAKPSCSTPPPAAGPRPAGCSPNSPATSRHYTRSSAWTAGHRAVRSDRHHTLQHPTLRKHAQDQLIPETRASEALAEYPSLPPGWKTGTAALRERRRHAVRVSQSTGQGLRSGRAGGNAPVVELVIDL